MLDFAPIASRRPTTCPPAAAPAPADPLGQDLPDDRAIPVTARGLARVAHVAAEAALRFEREGAGRDAVEWMTSPRAMFGGHAAVEACVDLRHCVRAALVHALDLGCDDDAPEALDRLVATADAAAAAAPPPEEPGSARLFTAALRSGPVQGFVAAVCGCEAEVGRKARAVFGAEGAATCVIGRGFDREAPDAVRFLSSDMAAAVAEAEEAATPGFLLVVERRAAA